MGVANIALCMVLNNRLRRVSGSYGMSRVFFLRAKKAFRKEIYSLHKSFISGVLPITTQRGLALLLSASYNRIFDFSKLGLDNGFALCAANSFPSNSW